MSYQVLARKYRPRRFADMVGQDAVVRTLTNALGSGRVHHAYVFSGIRGIGKTTSARLLARALNCAKGPTTDPCGECPACVEIGEGRSLDAIEIDAASNRGIEEVKALIQSAQYSPSRDRHKVFIVDEFHMLTREAFNALLKTLEEPPPHVVFILATTELEKVPATILSRCLLLPFRSVSAKDLQDHLLDIAAKENVRLDAGAAELIARKAGGSVRDAQSTLDRVIALAGEDITRDAAAQVLGLTDAAVLRGLLLAVLEGRAAAALEVVERVASSGADLHAFLDELLAEARAAMLVKILAEPGPALGLPEAALTDLRAIAAAGSEDDLRRVVDRLIETGPRLRTASEPRFVLEALVVRLAQLTKLEPIAQLAARLERGEGDAPSSAHGQAPPPPDFDGPVRPRPAPSEPPRIAPSGPDAPASPRGPLAQAPVESPAAQPGPSGAPSASQASAAPAVAAGSSVTPRAGGPGASSPAAPSAPSASGAGKPGGYAWRQRLAEAPPPDEELPEPPEAGSPRAGRPARAKKGSDPVQAFRLGLTTRMRGQVEHGALRREADGLLLALPEDRQVVREQIEEQRFHLMAAAAEAFGRPVPVRVELEARLVESAPRPGEVEGSQLRERRLATRAEGSSLVQALRGRFDARLVSVIGADAEPPERS